jgi:hypothetical protein
MQRQGTVVIDDKIHACLYVRTYQM